MEISCKIWYQPPDLIWLEKSNEKKCTGEDELEDESSKPDNSPNKTSIDELISASKVILEYLDWGGEKVSQFLTQKEICYLCPSTINRIKKVLRSDKIIKCRFAAKNF